MRFHDDILVIVLTTSCRQLVILSTTADDKRVTSLAVAHTLAKKNDKNSSRSPYSYVEGEGGASGSFRCVPSSFTSSPCKSFSQIESES